MKPVLPTLHFLFWAGIIIALSTSLWFVYFSVEKNKENVGIEDTTLSPSLISGCEDVNRESYGISSAVFEQLPTPPKCFQSFIQNYLTNQFTDSEFFTPDYFLQPEFYPTFLKEGINYWKNPNPFYYGAIGYGAYPPQQVISMHAGEISTLRYFFHTAFGVRSYQGFQLEVVPMDPQNERLFTLELDSESMDGFILGPTFPIFDANWVKDIRVSMEASSPIPQGTYSFALRTRAISSSLQSQWSTENSLYVPSTLYVGPQTIATLYIQVES